jgi:hypothetical protein
LESIGVPVPADGEWRISFEKEKVDICLWRQSPASVVVIENKSNWAIDQQNQLYRYWYEKIHKPHPELDYSTPEVRQAFQVIYLPPTVGKYPARHSLECPESLSDLGLPRTLGEAGVSVKVLTFRDHIAPWLEHCEQLIPKSNTRLKAHLQFYKEFWR